MFIPNSVKCSHFPYCGKLGTLRYSDVTVSSVHPHLFRSGTLEPGDQVLAIDDIHLDSIIVEEAMHLLAQADEIVKLKVKKNEAYSGGCSYLVTDILVTARYSEGPLFRRFDSPNIK